MWGERRDRVMRNTRGKWKDGPDKDEDGKGEGWTGWKGVKKKRSEKSWR